MSPDNDIPERPMMGAPMSAKRLMEIKHLVRDANPNGLKPLEAYNKKDVAATDELFTESFSPTAFEKFETEYVPLTMYVNGERHVIGQAKVNGLFVQGYIDETSNVDLKDIVKKNELNGVSFGFHVNSFKGDYPGAVDIPIPED